MIELNPTSDQWNEIISALPEPHLLQTYQWGEIKRKYGWKPNFLAWKNADGNYSSAAMVLEKQVNPGGFSTGFSILYAPRGPLLDWSNRRLRQEILTDLQTFAKRRKAIFIKIDPEIRLGVGIPETETAFEDAAGQKAVEEIQSTGWIFSREQIQFRNTAVLDISGSEEDWLARMHQKTRYNLRLAMKKGVMVRQGGLDDLQSLYRMYAETSVRDGFIIRDRQYYHDLWSFFIEKGMAVPLVAEVDAEPVAGLILFYFQKRAWYLYGMSRDAHREKMPNYLLQWEAMKIARSKGCQVYDLWGAPDTLTGKDSMQGVFRFKDGLGATLIRTAGAWDYAARPWLYRLYSDILPRILDIMRRRGRRATRQQIGL
jgi:lipid II:glycine glycyltransferase (peptidoglycan interpeptide bridge formation enzyme)